MRTHGMGNEQLKQVGCISNTFLRLANVSILLLPRRGAVW